MIDHQETMRETTEGELVQLLVENVKDYAIFVMDPEGRVQSWNPGAERILGYHENEIIGQPAALFFTPEDIQAAVPQGEMRKALETGRGEDDRWHIRKNGSRFWSGGTITPLWDEQRHLRGYAKIMRDRTEWKHSENALKDSLAYAEGLVETVWEPLLVLRADLRVKNANRSFYQTFRASPADTEGRLIYHLGDRQWDIPLLRTLLEEVLPRNSAFDNFEVDHEFRAIGRKVMLLNARRVYQEDNQTELILLAMEDITQRRRAEEERREIETRFTSLVKNIKDHSIFTTDLDGRITSWNVEAEHILGYTESEIIGQSFSVIFTPEDIHNGLPGMELKGAREEGRAEDERWHVRKNGERFWALGIVTPTYNASGRQTGFSKILRDMTERKLAENALQRAHERAETLVGERTAELRTVNEGLQKEIEDRKLAERRLNAQHVTTKTLAESPSLEVAAPQILEAVCRNMGWAWAGIWMVDVHCKRLELAQFWHSPSANMDEMQLACREKAFARGEGLPGKVWAAGEATWVPDVMQNETFNRKLAAARCGFHGAVAFPIRCGRDVCGIIEIFSQRIEYPDNEMLAMMGAIGSQIGQFIEKKQAETDLNKEREFLNAVLENAQEVIVACDANGILSFFNGAARELHGKREQPLTAERWSAEFDLYHADGKTPLATAEMPFYRAMQGEQVRDIEIVVRPKGSPGRTMEVTGQIITSPEGKRLGAVVVMHDITERKLNEAGLRVSEERYRRIIETTPDGIWTLDAENRTNFVNRRMAEMLGYSVDEIMGQSLFEFMDDESRNNATASLDARRNGGPKQLDFKFRRKDASELWSIVATAPILEDGRFVGSLAIVTDISERNVLEKQLRQAQKMEAFGQLAGGVAHDFNNLLMIISGYSEMMLGTLTPDDRNRGLIQEINKAGQRASLLTRQLLAFSRKQLVQPQVVDLNALVASTEKMLGRLIGEDMNLTTVLPSGLGRVKVDPGQIEQVIINLVVNARDAMPQGGRITLETTNIDLDKTYEHSHAKVKPGSYVMLTVSDTGCGITDEVKRHMFEPFFTTKEVGKGSGLGLATVFGIVKQSGGHVGVYSEVGLGTTFKIYLPSVAEVIPAIPRQEIAAQVLTGTETILLVEDEKVVRTMTRFALQANGYTVLEAGDGGEALRINEQHPGAIQLLISDVVMPHMGGRQLAERLAVLQPEIRVLFVSGYTDDAVVRHGVLQADVAFLQKPFPMDALYRMVRKLLDAPA